MSIGVFVDKKQQPTEEEIHQVMGPNLSVWQELVEFIVDDIDGFRNGEEQPDDLTLLVTKAI